MLTQKISMSTQFDTLANQIGNEISNASVDEQADRCGRPGHDDRQFGWYQFLDCQPDSRAGFGYGYRPGWQDRHRRSRYGPGQPTGPAP